MNYILFCQVLKPLKGFVYDLIGLSFGDGSSCPYSRLQIPIATQLSDDVAVVSAGEHLVAFQDVGMVKSF